MPLEALRARAEPLPEGVDAATALIASVPPKMLREATGRCSLEATTADFYANNFDAEEAERTYEEALRTPLSRAARQRAREHLERVLADQQAAKERHRTLAPTLALAQEIDRRQHELAKPFRRLGTAACAVALGAGAVYLGFDQATISNHRQAAHVAELNRSLPPSERVKIPPESLDAEQIGVAAVLGVAGAAAGTIAGINMGTSDIVDHAAQRRARRTIRIARKKTSRAP